MVALTLPTIAARWILVIDRYKHGTTCQVVQEMHIRSEAEECQKCTSGKKVSHGSMHLTHIAPYRLCRCLYLEVISL